MIQFVDQTGIYNPATNAIRFFALDGHTSIMFTVSREALEDLEEIESLKDEDLTRAFEKHLGRIRTVAESAYRANPGSAGAYVLTSHHFLDPSESV